MKAAFEGMKEIRLAQPVVSVKSAINDASIAELDALAQALLAE